MFILYLAAFSSFWFQCTRSGEMPEPARWQSTHIWFVRPVALAAEPTMDCAKTVCLVSQLEPVPLAWQLRQASLLTRVFQLSPCGVAGLEPEWHLLQLRRSCGKPTSEKSCRLLLLPQIV